MSALKIKVGASLEADAKSVFQPLEKAAEQARKKIQGSLGRAFDQGPYRTSARGVETAIQGTERATAQLARVTGSSVRDIKSQFRSLAEEAKRDLNLGDLTRAAERELARVTRQAARARLGFAGGFFGGGGGRIGIGRRAAIGVGRGTAMLYGYGGAFATSMMRGLGVNTDVASMISQGQSNEDLAQKIINSAPEYSSSSVSSRQQAAGSLLGQAQSVSNATATDTGETLQALEAFVAKTGDLDTAKSTIGDLAKLARATGSNLQDMANAAAEVDNNLGDVPDKGKAVAEVMRAIAGQGKLGAVEIKDLASQMAKIATQAGAFEGDSGHNIAILGAMAQEAKLRGGAASAQQATTSVMSFVSALRTPTTVKNWAKAMVRNKKTGQMEGLNPYTDATHTTLRSPEELILEALRYSQGDMVKLGRLFPSKQAFRAVAGFQQVYKQAGGGEAGLKAVDEEFKHLSSAAMSVSDVEKAFAAQMSTSKSKVQVFNNEMQQTVEKLESNMLPAFEALAPVVLSVAKGFADFLDNVLGTKGPRQQKEAIAADITATNVLGTMFHYEDTNIQRLGPLAQPASPMMREISLQNAAPVFAAADKQEDALKNEIAEYTAKVAKERGEAYYGSSSATDYDPAAEAAVVKNVKAGRGGDDAEQYLQDEKTLAGMQDTLTKLHDERSNLYQLLASGQAVVRIANLPPPSPPASGVAPANSSSEGL